MSNSTDRWEFYRDARTKWRWRRVATNGRIVDASTQGYAILRTCVANATRCGYKPVDKLAPPRNRLSLMGHFQSRYNGLRPNRGGNEHEKSSS